MGTDIHGIFQRHDGEKFVDVESRYQGDRHYQLFAVLAGVRNGRGFAGFSTGQAIQPIADPRGLPTDFLFDGDCHSTHNGKCLGPYWEEGEPLELWMGDHSYSWLTSQEMLEWYAKAPVVLKLGVITRSYYEMWDRLTTPAFYCAMTAGPGVLVVEESEVHTTIKPWTHVRVSWKQDLKEELAYFFEEVQRLHDLYGNVRFIFGFDS